MIEIKNITKLYGSKVAVKDVSFSLSKGEVCAFLGVNGAGKSTTMKILSGVLSPDNGQVLIFGNDIEKTPVKAKKTVGYLPEDNPLYDTMYVKEYLEYVASIYNITDKGYAVDRVIEEVGLRREYRRVISHLSKGNRQRVGLAQALIHDPDFLILDEPTSGLDPHQQAEIKEVLSELGKSKVILFSSHILHETTDLCNRYIIIDDGKIVLDEKSENIPSIEDVFYQLTGKNDENSSR